MPRLLHLDSSPLPTSVSRELGREFVASWRATHPDGEVVYRDLTELSLQPIDALWIQAQFTPEASRSADQKNLLAPSDALIADLEGADEYAIGVPMHNFGISVALKLWIDLIVRSGRTFSYGASGPVGLLKGKKATLLTASGGVYAAGSPMEAYDFVAPYLKTVLGFLGVVDVRSYTVGGVSQLMSGKVDRATLLEPTLEQIRSTAA